MKNLLISLLFAGSMGLVSCQKEEIPAPAATNNGSTASQTVTIEYRIHAASGNVNIDYAGPAANGDFTTISTVSNRIETSISFDYQRGTLFSIKASNVNNSSAEVIVEIYANGVLQKTATANSPGAVAFADVKIY